MFREDEEFVAPPCSVTKELVDYSASLSPAHLMKDGKVNIPATLFMLGFDIDFDGKYNSYYTIRDAIVRTKDRPYEVYSTTVYNGKVRREVIGWNEFKKEPIYHKTQMHQLERNYLNKEILTVGDINPASVLDVNLIGTVTAYNGN